MSTYEVTVTIAVPNMDSEQNAEIFVDATFKNAFGDCTWEIDDVLEIDEY